MEYYRNVSPRSQRVYQFCERIGYPIRNMKRHRIVGPRPLISIPVIGTEVFVNNLPKHLLEDVLFPFFARAGAIYTFRLMLSGTAGDVNRGSAYVTYEKTEDARRAILFLNGREVVPGSKVRVQKSWDNRRLYVGGIPDYIQRLDVWNRLVQVGMEAVVDVIMYKSYADKNKNRGYVFVEFETHQHAATAKVDFRDMLLYEEPVRIDWATPLHDVPEHVMTKVKKLFLRNLSVQQEPHEFRKLVIDIVGSSARLAKIYKFKDYAFLHFVNRQHAQQGMNLLREYYTIQNPYVEVMWARPPARKFH